MVFCSNLRNMGMILERLGMTAGNDVKSGMGKYGDGKNRKTGMGMGMGIPVGERGSPSPL